MVYCMAAREKSSKETAVAEEQSTNQALAARGPRDPSHPIVVFDATEQ